MWSRRILTFVLAFIAGIFDVTISVWFPGNLLAIRLALPLVTTLSAFSTLERSVTAALVSGIIIDVLTPSSFSLTTLRYAVIALAVSSLAQTLFSNRSLVGALGLGLFAMALDRILLLILTFAARLVSPYSAPEIRAAVWADMIWIIFCMLVVFILFAAFTRRFLPPLSRIIAGRGQLK